MSPNHDDPPRATTQATAWAGYPPDATAQPVFNRQGARPTNRQLERSGLPLGN